MTNKNFTDVTLVVDDSGSMGGLLGATREGIQTLYAKHRENKGITTWITAHTFANYFNAGRTENVLDAREPILKADGGTALLDAMGQGITSTGARLANLPERDRPGKVLFIVLTDGEENVSRIYNKDSIKRMVTTQTSDYKWEFIYMGANVDAFRNAELYGFNYLNTINVANNAKGFSEGLRSLSSNTASYAGGMSATVGFSSTDYKTQDRAGADNSKYDNIVKGA